MAPAAAAAPRAEVSKAVANKPVPPAGGSGSGSGGSTSVGAKGDKPVPAATPSPSVAGVQAAIAVGSKAVQPPGGARPAAAAPRQSASQATGSTRLDSSTNTFLSSSVRTATPAHTVEIVSRAPTLASQGAPPTATPIPGGLGSQGPATILSQAGVRAGGTAIPKGPAAVAVGRATTRGSLPAVTSKGGKPATTIAKKYQIVFISAEVAPWSKTGGLGEAMDGLPIALAALGHRVMTITPRYDQYAEAWDTSYWSEVMMGDKAEPIHAFHAYQTKVDRVFVDHPCFLSKVWGKTGSMLYGPEWGKDYPTTSASSRNPSASPCVPRTRRGLSPLTQQAVGALQVCLQLGLLLINIGRSKLREHLRLLHEKFALRRHSLLGAIDDASDALLAEDILQFNALLGQAQQLPGKVGDTVRMRSTNFAPPAIQLRQRGKFVDRILTVSPTYAWELLSLPEKSVELEDIFRKKGITGIINGAKETVSPQSELFVKKAKMLSQFGPSDVDEKKAELKAYLQSTYGLPVSKETALCVFLGRMDLQKGYDYLLAALEATLSTVDVQVVIVGTGRADLVAASKALAKKHPKKMYLAGWMGPERYALVAGADYMLMPSRWEPCGLAQIESMRFGTLPVVSQTGGLVDTVDDMLTGVHLSGALSDEADLDPASVEIMAKGLEKCAALTKNTAQVSKMRKAAMAAGNEYTWSNSALQYEAVCEEMGVKDVLPMCPDNLVTLEVDKVVS
eukprot:CAMPEP_0178398062 /NCGR_PEP_ID=MMETSP0689_2-20121128/14581_1 /TAXON_ID=160604 /ORGANISM="Amphidinium massartii, Strain CS-259" /LENGTH=733 /DNA_ID=CAMNT_0020018817 /DNA_START=149 /DNA_END=2353 /DNA_ORIENTATION=-